MVFLELLHILLLEFLVLLVNLILLLDHLDDMAHLGLVQDLVHSRVPEITQDQGERIQQNDVYVMIAQDLCFGEGLFKLLLDEDVDLA